MNQENINQIIRDENSFVVSFIDRRTTLLLYDCNYPHCTVVHCVLSMWLSFSTHRSLLAFLHCLYNATGTAVQSSCMCPDSSESSIHFVIPVASTLTSCLQHFRIYGGAILTSTRGLWTPVKCYFVPSSKWSDHKPSNRGINSQYWPVFLLRPAPMASSQNSEDRPPAQTFALMKRTNWAKHFLFYNCPDILDIFHGLLLVQALWNLALITASNF